MHEPIQYAPQMALQSEVQSITLTVKCLKRLTEWDLKETCQGIQNRGEPLLGPFIIASHDKRIV